MRRGNPWMYNKFDFSHIISTPPKKKKLLQNEKVSRQGGVKQCEFGVVYISVGCVC